MICFFSNRIAIEAENEELAAEIAKSHGSSALAVSALMKDMKRFYSLNKQGYIAYQNLMGLPSAICVLSDPVAPVEQWNGLLADFISEKDYNRFGMKRTIIFSQVSHQCALILSRLGLKVNLMGGETEIKASSYKLTGRAKRGLRQSIERARKEGTEVSEIRRSLLIESDLDAIKGINTDFFSRHLPSAQTSKFLNRPLIYKDLFVGGARVLVARNKGKMTAFCVLDPMMSQGKVRGYYANIIRSSSTAHPGTPSLLIHHAIGMIKTESKDAVLSLGLSPFYCLEQPSTFPVYSRKLQALMRWAFDRCQSFYPYTSIARSKSKWGGGSPVLSADGTYSYPDPNVAFISTYLCHSAMNPALDLIRLGVLCGMLDLNIIRNVILLCREPRKESDTEQEKRG
jgi:lysylphosphatidylglycerol synthetase-like protein (DUF2156 family)